MSETERGLGGYLLVALVTAGIVYSCSANQNKPSAVIPPPAPMVLKPVAPPPSAQTKPVQIPSPVSEPAHLYDSSEGITYYYGAAVSDEQRKQGKVAPDMIAFWYLGRDGEGRDQIQRVINGAGGLIAKCARPCKVIHYEDGTTIGFKEQSVIGGAFVDAQRGFLKRKQASPPVSEQEPWSGYKLDRTVTESNAAPIN